MCGGVAALVMAIILGPRRGRFYDDDGVELEEPKAMGPHSVTLQVRSVIAEIITIHHTFSSLTMPSHAKLVLGNFCSLVWMVWCVFHGALAQILIFIISSHYLQCIIVQASTPAVPFTSILPQQGTSHHLQLSTRHLVLQLVRSLVCLHPLGLIRGKQEVRQSLQE